MFLVTNDDANTCSLCSGHVWLSGRIRYVYIILNVQLLACIIFRSPNGISSILGNHTSKHLVLSNHVSKVGSRFQPRNPYMMPMMNPYMMPNVMPGGMPGATLPSTVPPTVAMPNMTAVMEIQNLGENSTR